MTWSKSNLAPILALIMPYRSSTKQILLLNHYETPCIIAHVYINFCEEFVNISYIAPFSADSSSCPPSFSHFPLPNILFFLLVPPLKSLCVIAALPCYITLWLPVYNMGRNTIWVFCFEILEILRMPKEVLFLEKDCTPLREMIRKRRILFLQYILN